MEIAFSPKCLKQLQKVKKNDIQLFTKIKKQLLLFEQNTNHPSLRLHKLSGGQRESWSISIDMSHRLLYYYDQDGKMSKIIFFLIELFYP